MGTARLAAVAAILSLAAPAADPDWRRELERWRQEREAKLTAEDGWLAVAGLVWLREGENRVERFGVVELRNGRVTLRVDGGAMVTVDGRPAREVDMKPDSPGPATVARAGDRSLNVIRRGGRYGVRLKDKNSKFRREFAGLRWFPADEAYRVNAKLVRHGRPSTIQIANILGQTEPRTSPGYVVFQLGGRERRLEPVLEDSGELFFVFKDPTSRQETYQAGRFLYVPMPPGAELTLDFNKAHNPPCAFNPYTTCPLPPRQNHLTVPVRAGEKRYEAK